MALNKKCATSYLVTTWRSYQAAARAEHEHEQATHTCPTCGNVIGGELQDHRSFSCSQCRGRFRVAVDPQTQRLALFEQVDGDIAEPLNMPKGSIRALVTIAMAVSCWILMFTADDVPLTMARLGLVQGVATVIASGMRIMGVTPVEEL